MEHGDHVALNYDLDAPLVECTSIEDWKQKAKGHKVFITPHHMGSRGGYHGHNWKCFTEGDNTPFVKCIPRHGLAESDQGDYPLSTRYGSAPMEGTIQYGLELRQQIRYHGFHRPTFRLSGEATATVVSVSWPVIDSRRYLGSSPHPPCAATGDKIIIDFRLNDAFMGDVVRGNSRRSI